MLGVIIPARNEEKNIANVITNLIECKIKKENIYVVNNLSSIEPQKLLNIWSVPCSVMKSVIKQHLKKP